MLPKFNNNTWARCQIVRQFAVMGVRDGGWKMFRLRSSQWDAVLGTQSLLASSTNEEANS